ncbi:MAG: hypothetical protein ACJAR1_002645 [Rubritalea sp.]|jgi:hypothetical protein
MKSNHFFTSIFAMLFLLQPSLYAQSQDQKNKVKVRVDIISMSENIPGLYLGKKKNKTVNALAFRYHETLKYNGNRVIQISQGSTKDTEPQFEVSKEDEKDALKPLTAKELPKIEADKESELLKTITKLREKNPDLVALATVPPGSRQITILLIPAGDNIYSTLVFDDDPSKMPYSKMKIHNFCKHRISMKFSNAKPAIIKPGKMYMVDPKGKQTVSYLLSYPKKKKWKPQESNIIRVTKNQQVRMIILSSKSSFFKSSSGARGGHLQVAVLRRDRTVKPP